MFFFGFGNQFGLGFGHLNIAHGNSCAGFRGELEAHFFDSVHDLGHGFIGQYLGAIGHDFLNRRFIKGGIAESDFLREGIIKDNPADGSFQSFTFIIQVSDLNFRFQVDNSQFISQFRFFETAKKFTLAVNSGADTGQVIAAQNHVQRRRDYGIAGRR